MARRKNSAGEAEGFRWSRFVTYLSSFCVLLLFAGLLVSVTVGMRPLEERASTLQGTGAVRIRIVWPPRGGVASDSGASDTWLPREPQEELIELAHAALSEDARPFNRDPLKRIGEALGESGWFEGPPRVRRETGSVIVVDGNWRIPAAVVRSGGRDYLISWDAKPMPPVYQPGEANLRVIRDPALGPPRGADGERDFATAWAGEDIAASLELLEVISSQPWAGQVAGIDASQYSSDGRLVLVTPQETRVVWGGRPSRPAVGDVSTAQKLANIAQVVHDFKRIDAGYSLIYVNSAKLQFDISATVGQ